MGFTCFLSQQQHITYQEFLANRLTCGCKQVKHKIGIYLSGQNIFAEGPSYFLQCEFAQSSMDPLKKALTPEKSMQSD